MWTKRVSTVVAIVAAVVLAVPNVGMASIPDTHHATTAPTTGGRTTHARPGIIADSESCPAGLLSPVGDRGSLLILDRSTAAPHTKEQESRLIAHQL